MRNRLVLVLVSLVAIVWEGGLPALFSQERVGRDLKSFNVHKLRTMVKNAEEATGPMIANTLLS